MEAREKTMVQAMLNSVKEIREVELLERCEGDSRGTYYIVKTEAGIKCTNEELNENFYFNKIYR